MKKKILSILVAICMLMTIVQPILALGATWAGGTSVPSLAGGFYQISTGEELSWFAQQVNNGSGEIKGKLVNDIVLNDVYSTANKWTPIGTEANPFKGEFDGGGFTVSGLYINETIDYVGLFGYVAGPRPEVDDGDDSTNSVFTADPPVMIHDINISSAEIIGNQNVGGVAGFIDYGIIKNCTFNGKITSEANNTGGIAGYINDYARIQRSYVSGSINGKIRTGGICGFVNSNAVVEDCYSTAQVISNASINGNAGGIAGTISASKVEGCYFLGSVMGPKRVGGIVGTNSYSTILGCYTLAPVYTSILNNTEYIAAVAGYSLGGSFYNCYFNEEVCLWDDANATARTLDQMKKFSFARELNENGNSFTYDYMVINNGFPVLAWTLETAVWAGGIEEPPKDSAGYYVITTADQLAWFARLVNGTIAGVDANPSANARIAEDIILNIFVIQYSEDTNVWTPIGTQESPFNGIFIGGGFNIAGLHTNGDKYQGLFGYVGPQGNVSEVVLLDGLIVGKENVGGIAGYNSGTISDSCNNSTVKGTKAVGGIVGYNNTGALVTSSFNIGEVQCAEDSGAQFGGVVGYNTRGTVRECFNNGLVTTLSGGGNYFGGVCGANAGNGIINCYNAGEVYGGYNVGGLLGSNASGVITNCYNRGRVNSPNTMNANVNNFVGLSSGTCTLTNCYFDTTIENSTMNLANGATGKTTSELTGYGISTALGFTSGVWSTKSSDIYFDYYPQILNISTSNYDIMKTESLESSKIVNSKYSLQVKIDGKEDTYYQAFDKALTGIGTKKGTIIPIKNITLNQTVNIVNNITIYGLEFNRTIKRDPSFNGVMFNVTGTLTLGDIKNGTDEDILLTFDGNDSNITATSPIINVSDSGTLNTYQGYTITNAKSSASGPAVYLNSYATANINGGIIANNETTADGGAVYNDMGTVNITAGQFNSNIAASKGGAVYNNYGIMNISGGSFKANYGKQIGGAIYIIGNDSMVTVSDTATFTENKANAGGAFYVNSGALVMTGGTVTNNFAYNKRGATATTGGGGAITVTANATATLTGGTIDSNYVLNNVGDGFGIASFGTLQIGGSVAITNNDIFLYKNKTVEIVEALTGNGIVATITPYTYANSTYVLSGSAMGLSYTKIEITPQTNVKWNVTSSGYLINKEIVNVASLSKFGAYSVEYVSLAEAVANIGAGEEGIITIIGNNTINETIKIVGDVTILSETDQSFSTMRGGTFTGNMFEVKRGGTLRLGYSDVEVEDSGDVSPDDENEFSTDSVGGEYHIDGGNNYYGATGTSVITVENGGTLYTYDDFILENGYSTTGTITVAGTMYMYGGTIRKNFAANGGGINISTSGKVYLYGGTITNNYLIGGGYGKAIYCQGTLTRAAHTYVYYRNDEVVATQNSYVTITQDNDVYFYGIKVLNLANVESRILLSDTSDEIPETSVVTATPMLLTFPTYSVGKIVLKGTDVGLHYNSFGISADGYYIMPDGSLNVNLLVPRSSSSYTITRGDTNCITGIDLDLNIASYIKNQFVNSDKIEVVDSDGNPLSALDTVSTGDMIRLYNSAGTQVVDTVYIVILGDVDCDGKIDGMDSIFISCIVQKQLTASDLSPAQMVAADIDSSASINNADAQYIQQCGLFNKTVQQY